MSRKIPYILISLVVWLFPVMCFSETGTSQILQLHTRPGKIIRFALSDNPVTTFSDGMLNVTAGEFLASYPLTDLIKYTYSSEISLIESVGESSAINIGFVNDIVSVTGLVPGEKVVVYGIDGTEVGFAVADGDVTRVDLSGFQTGIYIVKAESARLKILKK